MFHLWKKNGVGQRMFPVLIATGFGLILPRAEAVEPAVIVSVKSLDELNKDAEWLGERIGVPFLPAMLDGAIKQATMGQELKGVDRERPIGVMVSLDEAGQPASPLIFLPVSDSKAFQKTINGVLEKQEESDGVTTFKGPDGKNLFGTFEDDWYFLSNEEDALNELPDPALIVKSKADVSIDVDFDKFPKQVRETALAVMEQQNARQLAAATDDNEKRGIEFGQKIARHMIEDVSHYTVTLDVDAEEGVVALDLGITARRGTPTARAMDAYGKVKSTFAGLDTDDTVASLVFAMPLSEEVREGLVTSFTDGFNQGLKKNTDMSEDEREAAMKVLEVMTETLRQPTMDAGLVVNNLDGKLQVLGAASVADGDKLEELFVAAVKKEKPADLKLNAAKHGDIGIHAIKTDLKDEEASELLGDGPVNFAIASDRIVAAMGIDAVDAVKHGLDAEAPEDSDRAPVSLHVGVGAAMRLARNEGNAAMIDQALQLLGDTPDFVVVELAPHPRGASLRIEIEEGVLKLIGFGVATALGGGAQ